MTDRRLKYTRKGWFVHWFTMLTGTKDFRSGRVFPDAYGCLSREIWVGPFSSAAALRDIAPQEKG